MTVVAKEECRETLGGPAFRGVQGGPEGHRIGLPNINSKRTADARLLEPPR